MDCTRRAELERGRDFAYTKLQTARQNMAERIGICSNNEFLFLSDQMDRAWETYEQAQSNVNEHLRQHCCLAQTISSAAVND